MANYSKRKQSTQKKQSHIPLILMGVGLIVIALAVVILVPRNSQQGVVDPGEIPASVPGQMNFPAPELELTDLTGTRVSLTDYRGHWVMVNNWATWCPPCRAEMPELQAFYETHKDEGFVLVGISSGDTVPQIEAFVSEYQISFPMWQDPTGKSLRAFRMDYLPSSFVIDPSGTVRLAWTGAISFETLEQQVAPLFGN
jgi:peroxiredoxin